MSDEFDLLGRHDPPEPPRRRPWALLTGVLVLALLALGGIGWMVGSMTSSGSRIDTAAPATTTAAPSTVPPSAAATTDMTIPTVPSPTPSVPLPSVTVPRIPVTSAATVVVPPPKPTPVRTTPRPAPRPPVPRPTSGLLVEVPGVVGLKVKSAVATLEDAGFRVTVLGGAFAPGERDGRRVTAQRPGAGAKAIRGSVVVLITDGI